MHATTSLIRAAGLFDERTPQRAHFERMLAYVVCATVLVLPLAMAPLNVFFAHVVYRVGESAPGYPVHVDNGIYAVLDATGWPFAMYWMLSLPLWLAMLVWAVMMTMSARDIRPSRGPRWLLSQDVVLYAPFVLNVLALLLFIRLAVIPD